MLLKKAMLLHLVVTVKIYGGVLERTSGKLSSNAIVLAVVTVALWYLLLNVVRDLSDWGNEFCLFTNIILRIGQRTHILLFFLAYG